MIEKSIRYVALITSAIVVLSFTLFAIEETRTASATTRAEIAENDAQKDPGRATIAENVRESRRSEVRRRIDDANDVIVTPFAGLVGADDNVWVRRAVPGVLALLCFGVGLGFLARYAQGRSG